MNRIAAVSLSLLPVVAWGDESAEISFNRDIRPILSENCFYCHGPDSETREAGLRLDTFEGAVAGGDDGPAILPGNAKGSLLIEKLHSSDRTERMPPPTSNRLLTDDQKQLIARWIDAGAKYEKHWAFVPPERKPLEDEKTHPVDFFIRQQLAASSLEPSPEAPPEVLIRRLSLDLTGLPPTPAEVSTFLREFEKDPEAAYADVVDRLLDSPHFGERWARPWLDLARYADSNGFQADQLRDSWPYRDWVIDAINANLPYDQFTIEQIAGDLFPEPTLENQIATGFHRTVPCNVEAGVDPEENRVNQVVDRVNTTATVWLGLTLECAQCHDHKYDSLTMEDYYSFYAFFNNTPLEVELPSTKTDVSHDFVGPFLDLPLSQERASKLAGLKGQLETLSKRIKDHQKKHTFAAWLKDAQASAVSQADPDAWPPAIAKLLRKEPKSLGTAETQQLRKHFNGSDADLSALKAEAADLQKRLELLKPDRTLVMEEMETPRTTRMLSRGNYLSPTDAVRPRTPAVLPSLEPNATANADRLDLARWLVRRDNPLTARVALNRWWAELFGRGLVATLEDFGVQSEPPTHPELLDWLAVEFMESGWDRKHLLRLIVTSGTYRQSSRITPQHHEIDPENRLYARMSRFRLDAERVRDNALVFSGLMSSKMHGPPVMPYQPPNVWRQVGRNEPVWIEARDEDRWRRGIYIVYRRAAPYPSMVNFDAPDRAACTVRRNRTNTPLQALTLLNDPAYVEMAVAFADRVLAHAGSDTERIDQAFLHAVSRKPSSTESTRLLELLATQRDRLASDPAAAAALLDAKSIAFRPAHKDRNEVAAWYYVTSTILNLDEAITRP